MKTIWRFIKRLFGEYETHYEYWVRLNEIKISPQFAETPPKYNKMRRKWNYYKRTGKLESPITLNRDFTLVDGYTSYLICTKQGMDKVPVWFVD